MRQLFVVEGGTRGGQVVVATSDGSERFALEVDQALRAAVTDVPAVRAPRTDSAPPATEPRISPREIQVRIRAGEQPAVLAEACGAGLDWVLRFAGPVLSERARVAAESRRAKARRRSDTLDEGQLVVFGEAVDARFAAHGIDPVDVRWDAYRREDGQWAVTAHWIGGEREHTAEWVFQLSSRTVAPVDDTAADLLSDRPIRPLLPPAEPEPTPALTVAPPLMPGVVAFPVMSNTETGPLPTPAHAQVEPEPVEVTSRLDEPAPPPVIESEEPLLPMDVPDAPEVTSKIPKVSAMPGGRRRAESDDERAARATVPKWDDILLGVRRKRD
jgi:Protein of unknown function (DUF3071)